MIFEFKKQKPKKEKEVADSTNSALKKNLPNQICEQAGSQSIK